MSGGAAQALGLRVQACGFSSETDGHSFATLKPKT